MEVDFLISTLSPSRGVGAKITQLRHEPGEEMSSLGELASASSEVPSNSLPWCKLGALDESSQHSLTNR